jgi:hypothetical protein
MGEIVASVLHGKNKVLSDTGELVYQVSEGRKGRLVSLILTNLSESAAEHVTIYDAASGEESRKRLDIIVESAKTVVFDWDDLRGVEEFYSGVFAACTVSGSVWMHAGVEEY